MEIAFFLVGGEWYVKAAEAMIDSARAAMPACTITMLTDKSTPVVRGVDLEVRAGRNIDPDEIMFAKGIMWGTYAAKAKGPLVLTDVDVIFHKDVSAVFAERYFDVAVFYRPEMPSQPYLGGHVYSTGRAVAFWQQYCKVLMTLPPQIHQWWCDQIALNLLVGATPFEMRQVMGCNVQSLAADKYIRTADGTDGAYATHYKGPRKGMMAV